jgi:hypothetical protein
MKQMKLFETNDVWTLHYTICTGNRIKALLKISRSFATMNDALDYEYGLLEQPSRYRDTHLEHEWYYEYS